MKVYTLGRFEVSKEGETLGPIRKSQRMPLMLLKALAARGAKAVSEGYVVDLLWPDADGDMAVNSLTTTVYRLRKLLGRQDAVVVKNGRISLDPRICWMDSLAFLAVLDQADALWDKGSTDKEKDEAIRLACSGLDLYQGDFLPDEEENADALAMRELLRERYFRSLYRLCEGVDCRGDMERLRGYLEHGLAMDDCSEECYRRLMACLHKLGRPFEAQAVYERCRRMLGIRLGACPSHATEALARAIRAS